MSYKILKHTDAFLKKLPIGEKKRIEDKFKKILSKSPFPTLHNKISLINPSKGIYKLRIGDQRVFFTVNEKIVTVIKVKKRDLCYVKSGKRKTPYR